MLIGAGHVTESLLKNSNYGKAIDQCVENIRQSKDHFMEETHLYMAIAHKATFSMTLELTTQAYEMNSNLRRVDKHVVQVSDCVNGLKDHLDDTIKTALCKPQVFPVASACG